MKILFIHCTYQQSGGEDTVVREEMKLLRSKGVDVSLLSFDNEGGWRSLVQLPFNLTAYRRTKKKIAEERPDVVHIHNLHFGASPSVIRAVRSSGVPMVMTLHNYRLLCPSAVLFHDGALFTDSLEQGFPWTAVRKGVYRGSKALTAWLALAQALHRRLGTWQMPDRYIALTPHARKLFLSSRLGIDENKIVVKPNFSTLEPAEQSQRQEHFLYAGRLTEEKGLRMMLRVFAMNRWPLRIAGSGPLAEEVATYARSFPHITYLGALQPRELAAELGSATALIFPSLWFEGMPLTIIEAFACGTPVIASKLGAMESMIRPGANGLHFEPGDEDALIAAVMQWQGLNTSQQQQYREQALASYHELYSPEKNASQLLALYRSISLAEAEDSMVSAALGLSA